MSRTWQLQDAKNRFSEVVEKAVNEGPQEISKHGKKAVVVVSISEYERQRRRRGTLTDFFRRSPLGELNLERRKDLPREVSF